MTEDSRWPAYRHAVYHHRTQGKAVEGVHIRGVSDALRAEGIRVDIVCLPGADPYSSPAAMSPVKQARWYMKLVSGMPEPVFELIELAYNIVAAWRIARHLLHNPSVDFMYERYSLFMFLPMLVAQWRGVPVILEINDSAIVPRVRPLVFKRLALAIERFAFRRAHGLVFVSGLFQQRVLQSFGSMAPSIISPNAANIAQFSFNPAQREDARRELGLEDQVVCGYLGAFVPWHKIDEFVFRIADSLVEHPSLSLLLVGDGATFETVRHFVNDRRLERRVILTGRVAHQQVPGLLSAMDLAILPNAGDYTSPVKLFELMACGVPPIAPDFAPIQEVLRDGETGWIFPAGDLAAAAAAVLEHSQDREQLAIVGARARSYIQAHRQWRNNVLQLLDLLSQVAPAARR